MKHPISDGAMATSPGADHDCEYGATQDIERAVRAVPVRLSDMMPLSPSTPTEA